MALWKISDVWMESSAPGTLERAGISNELALAVNPASSSFASAPMASLARRTTWGVLDMTPWLKPMGA